MQNEKTRDEETQEDLVPAHFTQSVVLVGLMGAGKSEIGAALSKTFDVDFIDSDAVIEQREGMDIASLFERDGEAQFRIIEAETIKNLLEDHPPAIIATGGGAYMNETSHQIINDSAMSLWLEASPETLAERIGTPKTRPLLQNTDPLTVLERLDQERRPTYQKAHLTIGTDDLSLEMTVQKTALAITAYFKDENQK